MHQVNINRERLQAAHNGLTAMMNQLDELGFTPDEVLCGLAFTLGAALKKRGVTINLAGAIGEQLPPFALGYELAQAKSEQSRIMKPGNGFLH